jgi:teichuronic acid biosynthesis glycosyltransferase TuaG
MEYNPLVSIVIPTYNHAPFLRKAIDSIQDQTFTNWEAIIVNNYSDDDTEVIVESFSDPRIQLVNFLNNGIIAASRNKAIELAKGRYIAFLDSDDVWYPEKLISSIEILERGKDLVCHAETWLKDGMVHREVSYGPVDRADYHSMLFRRNCISTSAVTVRKSCLDNVGGFSEDPRFVTAEDYELWLRLSREGYKFFFLGKRLGEYTLHDGNNSRLYKKHMSAELSVLKKHFSEYAPWTLKDAVFRLYRLTRVYLIFYYKTTLFR